MSAQSGKKSEEIMGIGLVSGIGHTCIGGRERMDIPACLARTGQPWTILYSSLYKSPATLHSPIISSAKSNTPTAPIAPYPSAHAEQQKPNEETADDRATFHGRIVTAIPQAAKIKEPRGHCHRLSNIPQKSMYVIDRRQ
jgi:hypothetical protein